MPEATMTSIVSELRDVHNLLLVFGLIWGVTWFVWAVFVEIGVSRTASNAKRTNELLQRLIELAEDQDNQRVLLPKKLAKSRSVLDD
jgi:hypothetical protein